MKLHITLLALFLSMIAFSQERKIIGRIVDVETNKPISNANIVIAGTAIRSFTNQHGFFELYVDTFKYNTFVVLHVGYKTSEFRMPAQDRFRLSIERNYIRLNPVNLNHYSEKQATANGLDLSKMANDEDSIGGENPASYPGGMDNFYAFIGSTLDSGLYQIKEIDFNIRFTINEKGRADEIELSDTTKLLQSVVYETFEKIPNWVPATQRHKNVAQYFMLPISKGSIPRQPSQEVLEFFEYVFLHIQYPLQARKMGVEGVVVVEFIIDDSGKIANIKLLQDIGEGCGDEVKKLIAAMPTDMAKLLLEKMKGNKFILPVSFGLEQPYKTPAFTEKTDGILLNGIAVTAKGR